MNEKTYVWILQRIEVILDGIDDESLIGVWSREEDAKAWVEREVQQTADYDYPGPGTTRVTGSDFWHSYGDFIRDLETYATHDFEVRVTLDLGSGPRLLNQYLYRIRGAPLRTSALEED